MQQSNYSVRNLQSFQSLNSACVFYRIRTPSNCFTRMMFAVALITCNLFDRSGSVYRLDHNFTLHTTPGLVKWLNKVLGNNTSAVAVRKIITFLNKTLHARTEYHRKGFSAVFSFKGRFKTMILSVRVFHVRLVRTGSVGLASSDTHGYCSRLRKRLTSQPKFGSGLCPNLAGPGREKNKTNINNTTTGIKVPFTKGSSKRLKPECDISV